MQKKLVAIAVAGALGVPALALAQTSTVNIYGKITYEYGHVDSGPNRNSTDYADVPGGSEIGFRGEEKLGGGLSAWFQCNTSADVRALDQVGLCSRNSAVGFKGGFGNIFFGRWDTPMKRALNVGTVGAEETGILGMSFLPFGGSGGADATFSGTQAAFNNAGLTSGETAQRQRWKRREAGMTNYESPVFSGFQVMASVSSGNGVDNSPASGTPNAKPRVWSFAGVYNNGPLGIGAAYEMHDQFGVYNGAATDLDDRAWGLSAAYTFGAVKVGATYLNTKYETSATTERKRYSWTIGVDWNISGPHSVMAQYANMSDVKGNDFAGVGGRIGGSNGGVGATASGTGGDAISIAYNYAFSKRTAIKLGYVRVNNDGNTNGFRVGNSQTFAAGIPLGQNVDGYAMHISHRF